MDQQLTTDVYLFKAAVYQIIRKAKQEGPGRFIQFTETVGESSPKLSGQLLRRSGGSAADLYDFVSGGCQFPTQVGRKISCTKKCNFPELFFFQIPVLETIPVFFYQGIGYPAAGFPDVDPFHACKMLYPLNQDLTLIPVSK